MPYGRPFYTGQVVNTRKCWYCVKAAVDGHDDLGLCPDCIERLRDPEFTRDMEDPINADASRSV